MLRKLLAALSVALVALLFTSPTALATDDDNTNNVTYWENYYGGNTVCYKDDSSKGTVSGKTVTLKDNGWTHLIVKGGSVDTGDGPGNIIYNNPVKNTPYAAPDNSGGQPSDVSHWIVCGPPPFDWNWQYEAPTCTALVVVYPEDIPAGQANDVNVKIKNLITDEFITLNFHKGDGTWSGTKTFTFSDAANWPAGGLDYYAVKWVQVGGTNYHWEGNIVCGEEPPSDVCKNIEGDQAEVPAGYMLEDGNCVHEPVDICVNYEKQTIPWDEYNGNEEQYTLFSDSCHPPMCENMDKSLEWAQAHGYFVEDGNCFKKVYVCKYVTTPGDFEVLQTGNNPIAVSVNALPDGFTGDFPWAFSDAQGKSIAFAYAVPGTPQDEEPGLEDCPQPPPVKVCEYINGVAVAVEYAPNALPEHYILWVNGSECTPVDKCENLTGYQGAVPEGWTVEDGYCFHEETVCWLMDNYNGGDDYPPAGAYSTFPQTRVDCETTIPCGMWIQKDVYHIDSWTDETLWVSLGDILEWVNGHPEDSAIYKSHVFLYGGDCPPPPPMCKNIEKTVEWATSHGYYYDDETGDCFKKVYVCKYVTTPGGVEVLQTGNNPISVSVNTLKDFPGTFPWEFVDAQGKSIAFAWAEPGTPQNEEPGLEDCPQPEPVQVCIDNALATVSAADYAADPEKYVLYERETCHPPVDVCPNIEGPQSEVPEGLLLYGEGSSTKCATPPSLEGTLFASQCVDDVPWVVYDVNLVDPDDVSTDDGTATFTFTAPGHPGLSYVKTVDIGSGKFLWPGATATDNGDGTYTATGWPGWALVAGEWVSIGDDNYGWTRDGVNVTIEVNPEMTVSLTYPPPTALCVAGPPTEIDNELDAPPATPVEAEAQFAG